MKLRKDIGDLLDTHLTSLHISSAALATSLDLSTRVIEKWRRGDGVTFDGIEAAFKALGLTVDLNLRKRIEEQDDY